MTHRDNSPIKNNKPARLVREVLEIGCNPRPFIFISTGNLKVHCKLDAYPLVNATFGPGPTLMSMHFPTYVLRSLRFFLDRSYSIFRPSIHRLSGELKSVNGEYTVYSFHFPIVDTCIVDFTCVKRNSAEFKTWKLNIQQSLCDSVLCGVVG